MIVTGRTIKVGGLDPGVDREDLKGFFSNVGHVVEAVVGVNYLGASAEYGFVVFANTSSAETAHRQGQYNSWSVRLTSEEEEFGIRSALSDQNIGDSVLEAMRSLSPGALQHTWNQLQGVNQMRSTTNTSHQPPLEMEPPTYLDYGSVQHASRMSHRAPPNHPSPPEMVPPTRSDFGPSQQASRMQRRAPSNQIRPHDQTPQTGPVAAASAILQEQPKLPPFSGLKGKDSTYGRWSYEVKCLAQGPYTEYLILTALRSSLKSPAAELLVRMGPGATVEQILRHFDSRYGTVLPADAMLEKFFSLRQDNCDCTAWAFQLEDVAYQAQEKGAIQQEELPRLLKSRFWRGLRQKPIQEALRSRWEAMMFDDLVTECRVLEEEYNNEEMTSHQALATLDSGKTAGKVHQAVVKDPLAEILSKMDEMSARMEALERQKATEKAPVSCTKCKKQGHLYWGCRPELTDPCPKCDKPGHLTKACRPLNN